MRILGLDHGERRIGVAVSDATGTIATPHSVIDRRVADVPVATRERVAVGRARIGLEQLAKAQAQHLGARSAGEELAAELAPRLALADAARLLDPLLGQVEARGS